MPSVAHALEKESYILIFPKSGIGRTSPGFSRHGQNSSELSRSKEASFSCPEDSKKLNKSEHSFTKLRAIKTKCFIIGCVSREDVRL